MTECDDQGVLHWRMSFQNYLYSIIHLALLWTWDVTMNETDIHDT